eukprot:scaffold107657_cov41-Tisochrysis_lutea.AAC.1
MPTPTQRSLPSCLRYLLPPSFFILHSLVFGLRSSVSGIGPWGWASGPVVGPPAPQIPRQGTSVWVGERGKGVSIRGAVRSVMAWRWRVGASLVRVASSGTHAQ